MPFLFSCCPAKASRISFESPVAICGTGGGVGELTPIKLHPASLFCDLLGFIRDAWTSCLFIFVPALVEGRLSTPRPMLLLYWGCVFSSDKAWEWLAADCGNGRHLLISKLSTTHSPACRYVTKTISVNQKRTPYRAASSSWLGHKPPHHSELNELKCLRVIDIPQGAALNMWSNGEGCPAPCMVPLLLQDK